VKKPCPRCQVSLEAVTLGTLNMHECTKCEGLWVGVETFNGICADRDKQAAVLGGASPQPVPFDPSVDEIRYLRCPECATLMNRVNFAGRSGVIIDVCRGHGTWFDRDELRHIVEFIRAGGLEEAREREIRRLKEAHQHPTPTGGMAAFPSASNDSSPDPVTWRTGWAVADALAFVGGVIARLILK